MKSVILLNDVFIHIINVNSRLLSLVIDYTPHLFLAVAYTVALYHVTFLSQEKYK